MAMSKSTREEYYEFLDLSGVDDNEKNELKSTLYDNNGNNSNSSGGCASVVTNSNKRVVSTNNSGNSNWNRGQQNIGGGGRHHNYHHNRSSYQSNSGSGGPLNNTGTGIGGGGKTNTNNYNSSFNNNGNSGGNYGGKTRPKPTAWIKNRKFQPQSSGVPHMVNLNSQTTTSKRYEYQHNHSENISSHNSNSGGGSSSHISDLGQQPAANNSRNSNRLNTNAKRSEVSDQVGNAGKIRTSGGNNRRTNSVNSCYSTDTSIDNSSSWNDDDTNYVSSDCAETQTEAEVKALTDYSSNNSVTATPDLTNNIETRSLTNMSPYQQQPASVSTASVQQPAVLTHQSGGGSTPTQIMNNNTPVPGQGQPVMPPGPGIPQQNPMYTPSYPLYASMPVVPSVVFSNVTASVNVHGIAHPVQYVPPSYMNPQDVPQTPTSGHETQSQTTPPVNTNQTRGNRRGRGRTSSGSSGTQRREFIARPGTQQEMHQPVMDPQAPMVASAYPYYMAPYPPYYASQSGAPHPTTPHPGAGPMYIPVGYPMYSYPTAGLFYHMMPQDYMVDEKGEEQNPDAVPQMWPANQEYQDPNQIEGQIPPQEEFVPQPQMIPPSEEVPMTDDINQNTQNVPIHHQPMPIHHVLNPNVATFTVNPQPNEQIQVQHYAPSAQNAGPNAAGNQPQEYVPQGSLSPVVNMVQSYSKVSQHVAMAAANEANEQHQTFVQAAASVTVANAYTMIEVAPTTVQPMLNTTNEISSSDQSPITIMHSNSNSNLVTNQVPSQQPAPLPQRIREPSQTDSRATSLTKQGSSSSLTKTISSSSLTAMDNNVNSQTTVNVPNQSISVNNTTATPLPPSNNNVNNQKISNDDVNKLLKVTNEKLNIASTATTGTTITKIDRFGGANNKPVAWNTSKKSTTSVSVSAIPAKETTTNNKTATVQPSTSSINQAKLSPPPFTTSNVKLNTTSIVPKLSTQNIDPNKIHSSEKKSEVMQKPMMEPQQNQQQQQLQKQIQMHQIQNQMIEAKKVEQQNKEITANVSEKKPVPPTLSLAPPPQPQTADDNKQGVPKQSWASLFSSSNNSSQKISSPSSLPYQFESTKRPVAKVSPFEGTPSPVTPPISSTGGISYSAASAQGLQTTTAQTNTLPQKQTMEKKPVADEYSLKLANFFQNYKIDNNSISILPRGLINKSNYCYINAILQALVSCPPFYHLMRDMPKQPPVVKAKGCTPIMDAMQEIMFEFQPRKVMREKGTSAKDIELTTDTAFEPTIIYKMLNGIRSEIFHVEGRQEDAEEFLGCILNRLNDEMLEIIKLAEKPSVIVKQPQQMANQLTKEELSNGEHNVGETATDADGDDWQVIGSKNKGTITRTTDFGRTPISDIFRGKLRSRVTREGDHSTDNIQPFFTLQLDIERARTVYEALDLLCGRDPLEGITSSKTNQEVTAWQQVAIEELPVVLVLHLKYFDYRQDGCTKIVKPIEFPVELKIEPKLLTSKLKYSLKQRTYKLFAVVYHDGKEASKGHYLTDAFHIGYSSWIRYDDCTVKLVTDSHVLKPIPPRVPYLLYYRRYDTINGPNNNNSNNNNNNSSNNTQQRNYHHK